MSDADHNAVNSQITLQIPRSYTIASFAGAVGNVSALARIAEAVANPFDGKRCLTLKDDVSCDALSWASRNGHQDVVAFLLSRDADVESKSYGGMRPLHHAAQAYDDVIIRNLLAQKADPNMGDDAGNTAFHYTCKRGVLNLCQLLADAKADTSKKNNAGMTPLFLACTYGQVRILGGGGGARTGKGRTDQYPPCKKREGAHEHSPNV